MAKQGRRFTKEEIEFLKQKLAELEEKQNQIINSDKN